MQTKTLTNVLQEAAITALNMQAEPNAGANNTTKELVIQNLITLNIKTNQVQDTSDWLDITAFDWNTMTPIVSVPFKSNASVALQLCTAWTKTSPTIVVLAQSAETGTAPLFLTPKTITRLDSTLGRYVFWRVFCGSAVTVELTMAMQVSFNI